MVIHSGSKTVHTLQYILWNLGVSLHVTKTQSFFSDGLNLFWFYLMFKILISTTPAIKPLMEKKKVEIKIRTQEFHEKMIMMKNKNLLKMNKMKDNMVEKVQDNIENVRDHMTGTGFLRFSCKYFMFDAR